MILVGITGEIGSGKDTAYEFFSKNDFRMIRLSDIISEELKKRKMKETRENKQKLGTEMRKQHGNDILAKLAMERAIDNKNYIFNGIRHPAEAKYFREHGCTILYIKCDQKARFNRVKERDRLTWEQFLKMDKRESEKHISDIKADFIVDNSKTKEEFFFQLENLMEKLQRLHNL